MMSTISDGATTVIPRLILGHRVERESRNVIHAILGRPDPDVTLREASLRTGNLRILCMDVTAAYAALALHSAGAVLNLTDTDIPEASMSYVVTGRPKLALDEESLERTVVEAPFQEVAL